VEVDGPSDDGRLVESLADIEGVRSVHILFDDERE
jgi:hypothetical protein